MGGLMGKVDLPYVQIFSAKGRLYGYYRRPGIRTRIPGVPGSPQFLSAYADLHAAAEAKTPSQPGPPVLPGSLRALWAAYRAGAAWTTLGARTKKEYAGLIEPLLQRWGDSAVATMTPEWVQRRIDERSATPSKANHFLAVLRLLLNWAIPRGWMKVSPAAKVKRLKHKPQSHRRWTDAEITAMSGPDAGPVARAVIVGLCTGQRLGDVLRLPWGAYDGHSVTVAAQGKTGVRVKIPALPELQAELDAAARSAVVICTRPDGHAWKVDHFKHVFAATRTRLGLPADLHFHGLRHTAGVRLALAGCSAAEIAAVLGHKTLEMVQLYIAQASQEQLAGAAITRLKKSRKTKASVKPAR
jgi:integrase